MFDDSILKKSGQGAKALSAMAATLIGGAAVICGVAGIWGGIGEDLAFALIAGGVVLGLGGMMFGLMSVSCPHCQEKWLWSAMKQQHSNGWLLWLMSQPVCPRCGK